VVHKNGRAPSAIDFAGKVKASHAERVVLDHSEAHRAELISQIDLCVVGDGNSRTAANDLGPRPSPYRSRPRLQNGP
jgi:hypothetical protein